jgi:hypothetical protein
MARRPDFPEYDLHPCGARVDDALAQLNRIVSQARGGGADVFAVITGYGSSGGTAMIKSAVLSACRKYRRQNHIRGFLDGEYAGDIFSAQYLSFPEASRIPVFYKRFPNPGLVFICV